MTEKTSTALALPEADLLKVLSSSLYPGAALESIRMVIAYCKAAGFDPMLKPVHIVPMWDGSAGRMRDVIMPGIGLYRTQAARTGCAGVTEPEFGPDVAATVGGVEIVYPLWCRVTVKRRQPTGDVDEFTAKEFWRENYAVKGGKEKSVAPNAMWTKRPYGQLAKCFDAETEILTTHGFQRFAMVTAPVLQVTDDGLLPCDATVFAQEYDGEMIVADGSRLNFSVTPNHDMVTAAGKIEARALYEHATSVGDKFLIPRAPSSGKRDAHFAADTVLKLLGYFLADGTHTGHHQLRIAVSRPYKIEALRELALHTREGVKRDAGCVTMANSGRVIQTLADKAVFSYDFSLIERFVRADKTLIVDRFLTLSPRQARVVVDAVLEFDGSDNGTGVRRLSQSRENVLQGFEVAAVHAGYSISQRQYRPSDIGHAYTVTVSDAAHFPVVRGVANNRASLVKRRNVAGKVWCVTVPSGVIVVRRRGFSMLCGNCAEAQALRKAFPEVGSQPAAEEMEGRAIEGEVIDATTGEITGAPKAPPAPPSWPDEAFEKQFPRWEKAIHAGLKSADDILALAKSKGVLTPEQDKRIRSVKPSAPATEDAADPFVVEMEAAEQGDAQ